MSNKFEGTGNKKGDNMKLKKMLGFMFFTSFFAGCGLLPKDGNREIVVAMPEISEDKIVKIKYLGAGGIIIKRGEDVIMSAPFFSNFSIPELAFPIKSDKKEVNRYYKELKEEGVSGIIIGHSHYDHMIDLPYIHEKYHKESTIYCTKSAKNLLLSEQKYPVAEDKIVDITEKRGNIDNCGQWQWVKENRIRIMGIESSHSPHIAGAKFYSGYLEKPMTKQPSMAADWVEGETTAYLIDFMEEGKTIYRIYYQDAASNFPYGMIKIDDGKEIDTAVLCVGGYSEAENYPDYIVKELKPKNVMMIHWEDFFLPYDSNFMEIINIKESIGKSTIKFRERVEKVDNNIKTVIPALGYTYLFYLK